MAKIPNTWDECKTKEQKEAFRKDLERRSKQGRFRPFSEFIFEQHMKELSR